MSYTDRYKATLNAKQRRFVEEYLVDLNATQAATRAGYSKRSAGVTGNNLLKNDLVKAQLAQRQAEFNAKTEITKEMVLERYWAIATANPNELALHRRVNCRHCFGKEHAYQWKDRKEFDRAILNARINDTPEPTNEGGYGFNKIERPHPMCPECKGEGYGDVLWGDTRDVKSPLYAGIKQTKEGFEIKTHDQLAALQMVGRHLGMFNDKLTLKGDAENPLALLLQQVSGNTLKPGGDQ